MLDSSGASETLFFMLRNLDRRSKTTFFEIFLAVDVNTLRPLSWVLVGFPTSYLVKPVENSGNLSLFLNWRVWGSGVNTLTARFGSLKVCLITVSFERWSRKEENMARRTLNGICGSMPIVLLAPKVRLLVASPKLFLTAQSPPADYGVCLFAWYMGEKVMFCAVQVFRN